MDPRWTILIVLTLARTGVGFQFQSVGSVAPLLLNELQLSYADIGFLIGLYSLPGILLAIPTGIFGRRFGDTRVVTIGLILMVAGGLLAGFASTYAHLLAGRLASGVGAILLTVLMTKMITDWFVGREIMLAMAIFINAYPVGIGIALLGLGWLAQLTSWHAAFLATAVVSGVGLILFRMAYRPHPNDRPALNVGSALGISRREILLVSIPGAIWAIVNGVFIVMLSFTPLLFIANGMALAVAAFLVGLALWVGIGAVYLGGGLVQRWGCGGALILASAFGWAICLAILPSYQMIPVVVLAGLFQGLPVAVILSLPSEVLRPESRAVGMGVFLSWMYCGIAVVPPAAGWVRDLTDASAAPLYFASVLVLLIVPLYSVFRRLMSQPAPFPS